MNALLITILFAAGVFVIALAVLLMVTKDKRQVLKRMNAMAAVSPSERLKLKKRKDKQSGKTDTRVKVLKGLANDLTMSGVLIRPSEFLIIWIIAALVPACLLLLLGQNIVAAIGATIIGIVLPPFYVHTKHVKRVELFEEQLVDALGIICSSLKAGLTFQQALVSIANEMPNPISEEFSRVARELKLGIPLEKSLTNLSEKINSKNFMMIVSAILIQRQTGGNLSEILYNIAETIKERFKLKSEIKVLTTTARTSGIIVGLLPVFVLLIFMLLNPEYVLIFFKSNLGITMLVMGVAMEIIGYLFIRKIVNIKF
ncbi:type II secretion system F family protein [Acetobacterium bakii]|uniref:type II secretion system F family protein n=1 Tax=Acetobacterium bakii TaxID=52689 RepID=UPI0006805504|nr:type II secretion system F family protein [Acetobacterium bakii]